MVMTCGFKELNFITSQTTEQDMRFWEYFTQMTVENKMQWSQRTIAKTLWDNAWVLGEMAGEKAARA
jgi:hypothetical protein